MPRWLAPLLLLFAACAGAIAPQLPGDPDPDPGPADMDDAGNTPDAGSQDAGTLQDAGSTDAGTADAGAIDAGAAKIQEQTIPAFAMPDIGNMETVNEATAFSAGALAGSN